LAKKHHKNLHKTVLILLFLFFVCYTYAQDINVKFNIQKLGDSILTSSNFKQKLINNNLLLKELNSLLKANPDKIATIDSNALLKELISDDQRIQIITWAVLFHDKWEYFGILKSYNQQKKVFQVYELTPTDYPIKETTKESYDFHKWPASVYYKLIENEYNKKKYYSLLGWINNKDQTSYKIIEVLTLSKSGKPYFGKLNFFSKEKTYAKRMIFAYSSQSKFQLDYGKYQYSTNKWNAKKRRYDQNDFEEMLIVFDHLIPIYPDLKELGEFMVASGNTVDAFIFNKGKWKFISDIDARNLKRKDPRISNPEMNLFDSNE